MERNSAYACAVAAYHLFFLAVPMIAQSNDKGPSLLLKSDSRTRSKWASEWLISESPLKVALGAWLARVDRQSTITPLLLQKVAVYHPSEKWTEHADQHDAMLQVLDALIAMRVTVPSEEAGKLYVEFPLNP